MRLYFAVAPEELSHEEFAPRVAYTATPALSAALPEEDEEGCETSAFLAAADAAVELAGERGRRVVLAADGQATPVTGADEHPGAVRMGGAVRWRDVAALFVDEESAAWDVRAAAAAPDSDEALERAVEHDLLWFDPSERAGIIAELGVDGAGA